MESTVLFDRLIEERQRTLEKLKELIDQYQFEKNAKEVMKDSSKIFDSLRRCIEVDNNIIYPALDGQTPAENVAAMIELHDDILAEIDKLIFIHVDEPYLQYLEHLQHLHTLISKEYTHTKEDIYPVAAKVLGETEIKAIEEKLDAPTAAAVAS